MKQNFPLYLKTYYENILKIWIDDNLWAPVSRVKK